MTGRKTWRQLLQPAGEAFAAFVDGLTATLEQMTDDELKAVAVACTRPTMTNVWWSVHQAAPLVAAEVTREQYRRLAVAQRAEAERRTSERT